MSTTNFTIKPSDGWVQIASAGASFTRVHGFPHTMPYYLYAGSAPPTLDGTTHGVLTCHKPYINNTVATDNLYARVQSPGSIRLDVIAEGGSGVTPTPPVATPFSNSAAGTSASFTLGGGLYTLAAVATWGSLVMNKLGPDGTTFISVSQTQTANGGQTLYLSPGTYQLVATGGSGYYASITQITGI